MKESEPCPGESRTFPRKWPVLVASITAPEQTITPEDVWNAAVRAGADPARLALSLSHVLGEVTYQDTLDGLEDTPALVRYTLATGELIEYDAGFPNPFMDWRGRNMLTN